MEKIKIPVNIILIADFVPKGIINTEHIFPGTQYKVDNDKIYNMLKPQYKYVCQNDNIYNIYDSTNINIFTFTSDEIISPDNLCYINIPLYIDFNYNELILRLQCKSSEMIISEIYSLNNFKKINYITNNIKFSIINKQIITKLIINCDMSPIQNINELFANFINCEELVINSPEWRPHYANYMFFNNPKLKILKITTLNLKNIIKNKSLNIFLNINKSCKIYNNYPQYLFNYINSWDNNLGYNFDEKYFYVL